jgi:hypothetical protein
LSSTVIAATKAGFFTEGRARVSVLTVVCDDSGQCITGSETKIVQVKREE